ncbi:hypothetical protein ACWHA3_11440 [Streptomyces cyaneofuscatus]
MNEASTKLAHLISSSLTARGGARPYRSFLVNSTVEALSGAMKLARQTSVRNKRHDDGWILLIDAKGVFTPFVDPLSRGVEQAMTPHVVTVSSAVEASQTQPEHAWSAVVVVRDGSVDRSTAELERLLGAVRAQGGMVVLCDSELDLPDVSLFTGPLGADVIVYGESLGGNQVPFGCFAMTEQAYEIWRPSTSSKKGSGASPIGHRSSGRSRARARCSGSGSTTGTSPSAGPSSVCCSKWRRPSWSSSGAGSSCSCCASCTGP